jgi:hypothetical protein
MSKSNTDWMVKLAQQSEQAEAATAQMAGLVAIFYTRLVESGIDADTASMLTTTFIMEFVAMSNKSRREGGA